MSAPQKNNIEQRRLDVGHDLIVGLVLVIAAWLLLMPFVGPIADSTLHRFHLRSGSFWWWAAQQPIPSMYNFANSYEVEIQEDPTGQWTPLESGMINHFPLRVVTFANGRYRCLKKGQPVKITVVSSYRGQRLETQSLLEPLADGGFRMQSDVGMEGNP